MVSHIIMCLQSRQNFPHSFILLSLPCRETLYCAKQFGLAYHKLFIHNLYPESNSGLYYNMSYHPEANLLTANTLIPVDRDLG